jgi:hypothetical protein
MTRRKTCAIAAEEAKMSRSDCAKMLKGKVIDFCRHRCFSAEFVLRRLVVGMIPVNRDRAGSPPSLYTSAFRRIDREGRRL